MKHIFIHIDNPIGDTVELTGVCRHGGINSYRNCMNCWTRKVIQNLDCNIHRKIYWTLRWSYWTSKMCAETTKYQKYIHMSRLRSPQGKKSWDANCQMTNVACITSHLAFVLVAPSWRVSTLTVFQVFRDPCHLWQGGLLKVLLIPARRHFTGVHICIIKITSTKEERNVHDIWYNFHA